MTLHQLKQLNPIDFAIMNLQPFTVDVLGVGEVKMCCVGKDRPKKFAERTVQMIASEFGMGCIEANPHLLFLAEVGNELAVNEEIVESLSPEMPWERWHGLRDDFHFTLCVQSFQAFDQAFAQWHALGSVEMTMFGKTTHVGDEQNWF